jgi:integrase
LFPELREYRGKYSHGWSKWWGRYRKVHGLDDSRKVFHSFRHTVKRKLRNAGVEKTLRDAIMGHDAEDEAERYGVDEEGTNVEIIVLKEAVEKISYLQDEPEL